MGGEGVDLTGEEKYRTGRIRTARRVGAKQIVGSIDTWPSGVDIQGRGVQI